MLWCTPYLDTHTGSANTGNCSIFIFYRRTPIFVLKKYLIFIHMPNVKIASAQSLVNRAAQSSQPVFEEEVEYHFIPLNDDNKFFVHTLCGNCNCITYATAGAKLARLSKFQMCIEALRICPKLATAYIQLSRMIGISSQTFRIPCDILSPDGDASKFEFLNRRQLLQKAHECDHNRPDIYEDLLSILDDGEEIFLGDDCYDRDGVRTLLNSTLVNWPDTDDKQEDDAISEKTNISSIEESDGVQPRWMSMFGAKSIKQAPAASVSKKVTNRLRSQWLKFPEYDNREEIKGTQVEGLRQAVIDSYLHLVDSGKDRISQSFFKSLNDLFLLSRRPEAGGSNNFSKIYQSLAVMEIEVPRATDSSDEQEVVREEARRCKQASPASYIPYWEDAEELLKNQFSTYKEDPRLPFDYMYLLACSRLARKHGRAGEASELLDEFAKWPQSIGGPGGPLEPLVAYERKVLALMNPLQKVGTQPVVKRSRNAQGGVYTPLVFKSVKEEWEYEKEKLKTDAEKLSMIAMDKVMAFVGLTQVLLAFVRPPARNLAVNSSHRRLSEVCSHCTKGSLTVKLQV